LFNILKQNFKQNFQDIAIQWINFKLKFRIPNLKFLPAAQNFLSVDGTKIDSVLVQSILG
jgi:hypothetical protein